MTRPVQLISQPTTPVKSGMVRKWSQSMSAKKSAIHAVTASYPGSSQPVEGSDETGALDRVVWRDRHRSGRATMVPVTSSAPASPELVADCSRCFGLCCVLLPFRAADGFGVDKPGGGPCHHLLADDRCGIHARLRRVRLAGLHGVRLLGRRPAGRAGDVRRRVSWREHDNLGEMAAVLSVMRELHEMLADLDPRVRSTPSSSR